MMHDKRPCIIFCNKKSFVGMFIFEINVMDCKKVERPPKLMTNEHSTVARFLLGKSDKLREPFVISIMPCKRAETDGEKRLKTGNNDSMIIKKIVIIKPTLRMAVIELKTMSEKSKSASEINFFCVFSLFFSLILRNIIPFIIAENM